MLRSNVRYIAFLIVTLGLFVSVVSFAQNTFETAEQLPLDETLCFPVVDDGDEYWWEVTTTDSGSLTITTTTDVDIDYAIYVYDANNTELDKDTEGGSETNIRMDDLSAGTYYILIECKEGAGDMKISTEFSAG